jgi:hypothetical protein
MDKNVNTPQPAQPQQQSPMVYMPVDSSQSAYTIDDDSRYMDAWYKQRKWWLIFAVCEAIIIVTAVITNVVLHGAAILAIAITMAMVHTVIVVIGLIVYIRKPKIRTNDGTKVHFIYRHPAFIKVIGIIVVVAAACSIVDCAFSPFLATRLNVISTTSVVAAQTSSAGLEQ